jgi:hypothetical protein
MKRVLAVLLVGAVTLGFTSAAPVSAQDRGVFPTVAKVAGGLTHHGTTFKTDLNIRSVGEPIKHVEATVQIFRDGKLVASRSWPGRSNRNPALHVWKWTMPASYAASALCVNGSSYGMKYTVRVTLISGASKVITSNVVNMATGGYAIKPMPIKDCRAGAPKYGARRGFY